MCLYIDDKVEIKFNDEGWIWGTKMVINQNNVVFSPFYTYFIWQPGWNISQDHSPPPNENGVINSGIHVYLDHTNEKQIFSMLICRVKCYKEDLIGVGHDYVGNKCAVFKRVWMDEEEYNSIIYEKSKI